MGILDSAEHQEANIYNNYNYCKMYNAAWRACCVGNSLENGKFRGLIP